MKPYLDPPPLSSIAWTSIVLNGVCIGLLVKRLLFEPLLEPFFLHALWYRAMLVFAVLVNGFTIFVILYAGRKRARYRTEFQRDWDRLRARAAADLRR